jgi:phosphoglycolate phosphatase-like HAD superfamily hydrolase
MATPMEAMQRRVAAVEAELFTLVDQVRRIGDATDRHAQALDDLEDVLTELSTATDSGPSPEPASEEADLVAWVEEHLAVLVRKTTTTGEGGGIRWCRQWAEHAEAVDRIRALQMAHRQLSAEQSDMWLSVYLRDHLDPHLATLTSPHGPFHACTPRKHSTIVEALGQATGIPDGAGETQ